MFNLYCFVGEDPEMAFNIIDGTAKYNDDYVKEKSFDTKEEAEKRMENLGARWIFYPNCAITETVGNKEILIGMYMAD